MILMALAAAMVFTSCHKEGTKVYDGAMTVYFYSPSVNFTNLNFGKYNSYNDSLETSFFLFPGMQEVDLEMTVARTGFSSEDTRFKVSVVPGETTAAASDYALAGEFVFPGGAQTATFPVTIKYSPKLDSEAMRLVLRLEESSDYQVMSAERSMKVIIFHNDVLKPAWWTGVAYVSNGFGVFSKKKYELLMMISDNYPFDADTPAAVIRNYALLFRQYLREQKLAGNTVYEDDGKEMVIPAGGN